jgi:hypothetical protein
MNPVLASGVTGATPVWHNFMAAYLKGKPKEKFEAPKTVKKMEVDKLTGMLPYEDFETRQEWFIQGTEPTAKSTWYQKLEICKPDGKIANDACRAANETEQKTFIKITAESPEWQSDVDKWVQKKYGDEDKYFPPTSVSKLTFSGDGDVQDSAPSIEFIGLSNGDTVPLEFMLSVEVSSSKEIKEVRIYRRDKLMTHDKSVPYGYNFSFGADDQGEYEFKAVAEDKNGLEGEATIRLNVKASSSNSN